jgi:hypothetical protein
MLSYQRVLFNSVKLCCWMWHFPSWWPGLNQRGVAWPAESAWQQLGGFVHTDVCPDHSTPYNKDTTRNSAGTPGTSLWTTLDLNLCDSKLMGSKKNIRRIGRRHLGITHFKPQPLLGVGQSLKWMDDSSESWDTLWTQRIFAYLTAAKDSWPSNFHSLGHTKPILHRSKGVVSSHWWAPDPSLSKIGTCKRGFCPRVFNLQNTCTYLLAWVSSAHTMQARFPSHPVWLNLIASTENSWLRWQNLLNGIYELMNYHPFLFRVCLDYPRRVKVSMLLLIAPGSRRWKA